MPTHVSRIRSMRMALGGLLLGAAICMGGVAIWCMHYIGNRATGLLVAHSAASHRIVSRAKINAWMAPMNMPAMPEANNCWAEG